MSTGGWGRWRVRAEEEDKKNGRDGSMIPGGVLEKQVRWMFGHLVMLGHGDSPGKWRT